MRKFKFIYCLLAIASAFGWAGCSKTESYSSLLKKEEHAANWYLSNKKVCTELPPDSVFVYGEDAPFYKLDEDGYVYMQVVNPGSETDRPETGDLVYVRYNRTNLKSLYETGTLSSNGNNSNMEMATVQIVFNDFSVVNSQKYGRGIQDALSYLGYNSEVNLVLRSYYGFTSDMGQCIPYIINLKYFKAEY